MSTPLVWRFCDPRPEGQIECVVKKILGRMQVTIGTRDPLVLTPTQSNLLETLLLNAGRPCTKEELREAVFGTRSGGQLDGYLTAIRNTFEDKTGRLLITLEGTSTCYQFLRSPGDLLEAPEGESSAQLISGKTPIGLFATVPRLPPNFIERPEISQHLIERLCSGMAPDGVTVVDGMGGIGKTTLVSAVCHDERVREAFPDGIVWLPIERETQVTLEKRIKAICEALNQVFHVYTTAALQTLLKDKAVLIVLDDVWSVTDVGPFQLYRGRAQILCTTRDRTLAGSLGAGNTVVDVGELDNKKAGRLLAAWAGRRDDDLPEPQAPSLIRECHGVALALAMVGAGLANRENADWTDALENFKRAQLKYVGSSIVGYPHKTLYAAISVSVDALPPTVKARYLKLALLLEGMNATIPVLQALWTLDEAEVRHTNRLLADRSLAVRDRDGLRIHDLQLKYLRGEYPNAKALAFLLSAIRRSYHVISVRPEQFYSQMTGRLLKHAGEPGIKAFLDDISSNSPRPRLRPLRPALAGPSNPSRRVLLDRSGDAINGMGVTSDGRQLIAGHQGGLVICDLEDEQPPRFCNFTYSGLFAITSDAKRAVYYSGVDGLVVLDLENYQQRFSLTGDGNQDLRITNLAVTPDDTRAIAILEDRDLMILDLDGGRDAVVLQGRTDSVQTVLSVRNHRAMSGSADGSLVVWDLEGGKEPIILLGHPEAVLSISLSGDGKRALTFAVDGTLKLWDLEGSHAPIDLENPHDRVMKIMLSANGSRAISSNVNGSQPILWDLEERNPLRILEGRGTGFSALAISADGKCAVSGWMDGRVIIWDLDGNVSPLVLDEHRSSVCSVALTADKKCAVSADTDGTIILWDLERVVEQPPIRHQGMATSIAIASDGRRTVSGSRYDSSIILWDLDGDPPVRVLGNHHDCVTCVKVTHDGKRAISGSYDGGVILWELDDDKPATVLLSGLRGGGKSAESTDAPSQDEDEPSEDESAIWAIAITHDGRYAVSGSEDHTLTVFDLETNQVKHVLTGHKDSITSVEVTPDGKRAISSSADHTLRVWDLESGASRVWEGHQDAVSAVAVTPDGKLAISSSMDYTLRVWDLQTDRTLWVLAGHDDPVTGVVVTPDGQYAISVSSRFSSRVWYLNRPPASRSLGAWWGPCILTMADYKFALPGITGDSILAVVNLSDGRHIAEFDCDGDIGPCAFAAGIVTVGDHRGEVHLLALEE